MDSRAPSQYPKRRLSVRSRKVSKPRDWYFKLSYRFEIWQAHRQHCCRSACQISERSDNSKYKSRGFETLRDLTERRLFGYWDGALDPTTRVLGLIAYPAVVVLGRWHSMGTHGHRHRHRHWHTHTDTHVCVCVSEELRVSLVSHSVIQLLPSLAIWINNSLCICWIIWSGMKDVIAVYLSQHHMNVAVLVFITQIKSKCEITLPWI